MFRSSLVVKSLLKQIVNNAFCQKVSSCTNCNVAFCLKSRFYYHSRRISAIHAKRAKKILKKTPKYTIIYVGKFVQRKIIVYYLNLQKISMERKYKFMCARPAKLKSISNKWEDLNMNAYCHIEEFGEDRYNLLPIMAYCFNHSVIWAPNMLKLGTAYKNGKSFFSPGDVLELIDGGYIQVIARERWYYKEERFKPNAFQSPDWLDGVDNALRDFAIEDQKKANVDKRVIIAPDEKGNKLSDIIMGSRKKKDLQLVEFVRKQMQDDNIPYRIKQRIQIEQFNEDEALKFILRSVINNNDAFNITGAQLPTMSDHADVFLKYMEHTDSGYTDFKKNLSLERVMSIIDSLRVIMSLNTTTLTPKKLKKLIMEDKKPNFIDDDFQRFSENSSEDSFISTEKVICTILSGIKSDIDKLTCGKTTFLFDIISVISLTLSFIGCIMQPNIPNAMALALNMPASSSVSRLTFNPPSRVTFNLPYLFAFGSNTPSYRKMKKLYDSLSEVINK